MSNPPLDANMLAQFTGSERFYRHALVRNVIFTEGVKYVADTAGAHWLIDEIALAQKYAPKLRHEDFQHWELVVSAESSAVLVTTMATERLSHGLRGLNGIGIFRAAQ